MNQNKLLNIVQRQGHKAKKQRDEVLVKECVFCANSRWNLELNANKGVFKCWACSSSGKLETLLTENFNHDERISVDLDSNTSDHDYGKSAIVFGSSFQSARKTPSAKGWLKRRGIRESDIERYRIKTCTNKDHSHYNRIVFPLMSYWAGDVCGYISRNYTGRRGPKYLTDITYKTAFGYRRGEAHTAHVVVEGVIDAIRVHQAGFNAHTLLGSGSDERFIEWAASVGKDEIVVLMLDGDEVGQNRMEALRNLAMMVRKEPIVAELPDDMDPADFDAGVLRKFILKQVEENE